MKKLNEIFDIKYGTDLELINCEEDENGIPFISRTSNNNGMVSRIKIKDEIVPMPGYAITVALGGSVLSSFFQEKPFYTSFHIACLYPLIELTESEMIYYCTAIEKNKYKYNYGRQANSTLKDILVPSPNEIPKKIKKITSKIPFNKQPLLKKKSKLNLSKWKPFHYHEIFEIKNGYYNKKPEITENAEIPFIGATEYHNGITGYCTIENIENTHKDERSSEHNINKKIFKGNCVTVSNNGSVGYAFYQTKEFTCSHDINVLYLKNRDWNEYIAMFICSLIELEKFRWAYGRKWRPTRMPTSIIKLPVTKDNAPDWQFMENYVKSLPYSSNL
ncbi:hypothetical protein COV19_04440 [Candidatus Woesearchaeota archaeon CG10_big_fil_rev_8_21_14_0_10_44_13]|nr:MAG: hypothetical protein COV19_04440 [Candidatus Woesearchaeota archaeon CG10_big_fil_rev_8_21_14_0_10_44_13]